MHPSAMENGKMFFETYVSGMKGAKLVEIGSQNVNGSLRSVCPPDIDYVGIDFVEGDGVDIVLDDPYNLPLVTESVDIVVSSSCFEHASMFWLTFNEVMRILKPHGLFYLNAPSNGLFHRYPVDCWRFYPDAAHALSTWAKYCGFNAAVIETYTSRQQVDVWNDFVAVFIRDEGSISAYPRRILDNFSNFYNGMIYGNVDVINHQDSSEESLDKGAALREIDKLRERIRDLEAKIPH